MFAWGSSIFELLLTFYCLADKDGSGATETLSTVAYASSKSLIWFCLHSNEQTGCLECLQYKFADCLHVTHHPNLPLGIPCSLYSYWFKLRSTDFFCGWSSPSTFFLPFEDFGTA